MEEEIVELSFEDFSSMQVKKPSKRKEELLRPVVEYTMDGEFVAAYPSESAAIRKTGITNVSNICKGRYLYSKGSKKDRIFLFRGDDINERIALIQKKKEDYLIQYPPKPGYRECWEYTLGGRLLFKYPTVKLAAEVNKVSAQLIHSCCNGKRLFIDKRIFLFPDGDIKQRVKEIKAELYRLSTKRPKYREVDMYDLEGNFIKAYHCANAASRELGIHVSNITRCCNGWDKHRGNTYTTNGRIFLWVGSSISDRLETIKQSKEK